MQGAFHRVSGLLVNSFSYEKPEIFTDLCGRDTVNSVGIAHAIRLGFTKTNDIVRTFRHAIALDEHRVEFKQNNWSGPPEVPDSADRPKSKEPRVKTDVEEVWFAGCHCGIYLIHWEFHPALLIGSCFFRYWRRFRP